MKQMSTRLPAIFRQMRQNSTILAIFGYENNFGEISDFQISFNISYIDAVVRAMKIWRDINPQTPVEKQALKELMTSFEDTMWGPNPRATATHAYERITDGNGDLIKGVKFFKGGEEVHLYGLLRNKRIVREGRMPRRKYSPVVKQKNIYRSMTPLGKFRQYRLIEGSFADIRVEKLTLTADDLGISL